MKLKSLILLGTLLLGSPALWSQNEDFGLEPNQTVIGHTTTNNIDLNDSMFGEVGKYSLGARLTAEELSPYKTCRIMGVRFAIGQPQTRTRVFINRVDGTNIYDIAAKNFNAAEGWNNVIFPEPITIKEGDSFFYGFDYNETAEMVAADKGAICSVNSVHTNGTLLKMNGNLYPITEIGDLCVQLIVDVTNLTPRDMNISFFDCGFKYKKINEPFEAYAAIKNNGREPISKMRLGWAFNDDEPQYADIEAKVTPGDTYVFDKIVSYPSSMGVGTHTFRLFIDTIEGEAAPEDGIKEKTATFATYANSVQRKKVYVEVYADPSTPYTAMTNDVFTTYPDKEQQACFVNVYPEGSELQCNVSGELHSRYAFTTPCFSTNRSLFPGEPTVAYADFNQYFGVFGIDMFHAITEDIIANDAYQPAFADLELTGTYDPATRLATIRATVSPLAEEVTGIFGNLALNLLVVENGVKAPQMIINRLGNVAESKNYVNPNVLRHACYETDGIKVENSTEPSTIEQQIELPANWNDKNIRIVALLTPWHEAGETVDLTDLDIINCNEVRIADLSASISEVTSAAEGPEEYFTITGQRTAASQPGIYIKKTTRGCTKVLKK